MIPLNTDICNKKLQYSSWHVNCWSFTEGCCEHGTECSGSPTCYCAEPFYCAELVIIPDTRKRASVSVVRIHTLNRRLGSVQELYQVGEISGSRGGKYEGHCSLGCFESIRFVNSDFWQQLVTTVMTAAEMGDNSLDPHFLSSHEDKGWLVGSSKSFQRRVASK
jgi:hypothetical protein